MREPWGGQSPRALIQADLDKRLKSFIFKAGAAKKRERIAFGEQLELFPEATKRGPRYAGASTLLPLPEVES